MIVNCWKWRQRRTGLKSLTICLFDGEKMKVAFFISMLTIKIIMEQTES